MKSLVKYLEDSFAIPLALEALPSEKLSALPLYLRSSYTFFSGYLLKRHLIFIEPIEGSYLTFRRNWVVNISGISILCIKSSLATSRPIPLNVE
jgi:hypothetical protein